jgi:DUF4097 and DUF4098 domain-containing protein YvlB
MGRKIGFLFLLLGFGATVETAWSVRHNVGFGPEGCRVIGGKFYGPSFTFDAESTRPLPDGARVRVDNAFGTVKVRAGTGSEVKVKLGKRVYRQTREEAEAIARRLEVVFEETSGGLRITTNREALSREEPHIGFETDLEIVLPPNTRLALKNEHGEVQVRDVAEADVESSFDDLVLERVTGSATVTHKHGDVEVNEVGGPLTLEARHGDVKVRGLARESSLDVAHGDLRVSGTASLRVKQAHGDFEAKTVAGDLDVLAEHGAVKVEQVTGAARLATSYEDLSVVGVGGDATLRAEHGHVTARDVKGAVKAIARFEGVTLENIAGHADVEVEHGGLTAQNLAQGAKVVSEGDEVRLRGFRGPVEVKAERGEVSLVPDGALTEPITVEAKHGSIRLEVAAGSRFELDASTTHGDLVVDLPGVPEVADGNPRTLRATIGGGGSRVSLRAENGEVSVTGGAARASN